MADLLHLVDKPEGWTSHDVVARLRGVLGERRVGHAGTLDPFATGLLIVAEGRATGLLGSLSLLPKRYRARARLGIATDTQDRTGAPVRTSREIPDRGPIEEALRHLADTTRQRPPLYSAVRVRGERLYRAARRGESPEREERSIRVYALTLVDSPLPDVEIDVTVSRGTYIRTLAHDLGESLGCGAHLTSLRRTASGPFCVTDALSPEARAGHDRTTFLERALEPRQAVPHLPRVTLTAEETSRVRHGVAPNVEPERIEPPPCSYPLPPEETRWPIALFGPEGDLLALAQRHPGPVSLRLIRVLTGG